MPMLDVARLWPAISAAGMEAAGWSRPDAGESGACHDYWLLPDGSLAIFLGDASDHGEARRASSGSARALARAGGEGSRIPSGCWRR
jgi:hypothetical protein